MNKYTVFKMVDKGSPKEVGQVSASSCKNAIRYFSPIEEGYYAVFVCVDFEQGK